MLSLALTTSESANTMKDGPSGSCEGGTCCELNMWCRRLSSLNRAGIKPSWADALTVRTLPSVNATVPYVTGGGGEAHDKAASRSNKAMPLTLGRAPCTAAVNRASIRIPPPTILGILTLSILP